MEEVQVEESCKRKRAESFAVGGASSPQRSQAETRQVQGICMVQGAGCRVYM